MNNEQILLEKLKLLSDKFTATLNQYHEVYDNYNHLINSGAMNSSAQTIDTSSNTTTMVGSTIAGKTELYATIPNSTYWGQMGLNEGTAYSPSECLADCYMKPACTGATFDSDTNYCWTRTGNGKIAQGNKNQTAIIKKTVLYKYQLNDLNDKLLKLNDEIIILINSNAKVFEQNEQLRAHKQDILNANKHNLEKTQFELSLLKNENNTIEATNETSELLVNRNYYRYIILLFLAIILGMFLVKILLIPSNSTQTIENNIQQLVGGYSKSKLFHL